MIGFPSGGILTYHRLAIRKATVAITMKNAGTPNARG